MNRSDDECVLGLTSHTKLWHGPDAASPVSGRVWLPHQIFEQSQPALRQVCLQPTKPKHR